MSLDLIGELAGTNMIQYAVPLPRRDHPALLTLPKDLSIREVERIVAFLQTLVALEKEKAR